MTRMRSIAKKSVFSRQLILRALYDISSLIVTNQKVIFEIRESQTIKH